ncbi:COG4315 family predicted lipoprotein [Compostimonas suwonensis]|uniref:Putative lipoprotein with Yx(FWY)xxD motif n=1 Tax=Compostimonas suwonensis TaxID=1048394 RepID=A0A2M9C562_9MICO|nr:hypothetical protein [Compostimonas suwonensis]PJJ65665.1 putative lipoprotein with Yx(FWY)xxD motif [Compostimonas suwonensis]
MKTKLMLTVAGSAIAILALAGCSAQTDSGTADDTSSSSSSSGSSSGSGAYGDTSSTPSDATQAPAASGDDLAVASSSLGEIVVDGQGMTAYVFDKDTQNATSSACTGDCAAAWPAIETSSDTPTVTGVTGTVGTITGVDGGKQITINGWPIYTFASDSAAGDVNGQAFGGVWWAISPAGEKIAG